MHVPTLSRPGLLFMDMDSTLIQCECIDEIAAFMGIKPQVAAITERAMRGELDFAVSLTERVQLLAGLDAKVLDRVYDECIELTDGAEHLIATLKQHGWKVGLVSGGFTYFTDIRSLPAAWLRDDSSRPISSANEVSVTPSRH